LLLVKWICSRIYRVLFWSPTRLFDPHCFSIYTRLQDL